MIAPHPAGLVKLQNLQVPLMVVFEQAGRSCVPMSCELRQRNMSPASPTPTGGWLLVGFDFSLRRHRAFDFGSWRSQFRPDGRHVIRRRPRRDAGTPVRRLSSR